MAATVKMTLLLIQHGYITAPLKEALLSGVSWYFMPHGLGHPVGLDVHDPVPEGGTNLYDVLAEQGVRLPTFISTSSDFVISPRHVQTIEPGIYFIPHLMELVKQDPELSGLIGWDKVTAAYPYGGVRIEDVLLVEPDGTVDIISRL